MTVKELLRDYKGKSVAIQATTDSGITDNLASVKVVLGIKSLCERKVDFWAPEYFDGIGPYIVIRICGKI